MDGKINGQKPPSLTPAPTPGANENPDAGGPEGTPPGKPRLPGTHAPSRSPSAAHLSIGTTPKVKRADLEKWIASAPSDKNESRHNVYRAILDSGKPSASVMVALCKRVGDEHLVCSEFVAHVLDARATDRIGNAHCHHLLMSMLRAMGPVARHDVDVFVAAVTRDFVAREGTREYHARLREAMMDSLSTLGEAIGLQGNNLNLKSPRLGSKEWQRQNDEKRLLGHLHPDKMRADRAVNARHAIAHTAWQSTGLRDEALKRFASGLDLGSHGKSAHAEMGTPAAVVGSAGGDSGGVPASPDNARDSTVVPTPTPTPTPTPIPTQKPIPTPTPTSAPTPEQELPPPEDPEVEVAKPDNKHTPQNQQTQQTAGGPSSSAPVAPRQGKSPSTVGLSAQVVAFLQDLYIHETAAKPERTADDMAAEHSDNRFISFVQLVAEQQSEHEELRPLIGLMAAGKTPSRVAVEVWVEQHSELANALFDLLQHFDTNRPPPLGPLDGWESDLGSEMTEDQLAASVRALLNMGKALTPSLAADAAARLKTNEIDLLAFAEQLHQDVMYKWKGEFDYAPFLRLEAALLNVLVAKPDFSPDDAARYGGSILQALAFHADVEAAEMSIGTLATTLNTAQRHEAANSVRKMLAAHPKLQETFNKKCPVRAAEVPAKDDKLTSMPHKPPAADFTSGFMGKLEKLPRDDLHLKLADFATMHGAAAFCTDTVAPLWNHIKSSGKGYLAKSWADAVIAALGKARNLDRNAAVNLLEVLSAPSMTSAQIDAAAPFVRGLADLFASKPELRREFDNFVLPKTTIHTAVASQFRKNFHAAARDVLAGKREAPVDMATVVKRIQELTAGDEQDVQMNPVFQIIVETAKDREQFEQLFNAIKGDKAVVVEAFTKYVVGNKVPNAETLAQAASRLL